MRPTKVSGHHTETYRPLTAAAHGLMGLLAIGVMSCVGQLGQQTSSDGSINVDGSATTSASLNGSSFLRRLSRVEYVNSVRDLIGGLPPTFSAGAPSDATVNGFDNNAENASFSSTRSEFYRNAAAKAAEFALSPAHRASFVGCDPASDPGCVRSFVTRFAKRAFRHPVADDEVTALVAVGDVAANDPDPYMPLRLMVQAALRSSDFLYRVEVGNGQAATGGHLQLSGYEVATRLSYLVLSTTPSDALLDAAAQGSLDTADGVEAQLGALLARPEAKPQLRRFFGGWLQLNDLTNVQHSAEEYPGWTPDLAAAMGEETLRVVEEVAWGQGQSILDVLTSNFTYVNQPLAKFYGLPETTATPDTWVRVTLEDGSPRSGLLTLGSTLTATAADHDVLTVIRRGNWVRSVVMCDPMPPPPPDAPPLGPTVPGQSIRDRLATHRDNIACSGCHNKMDPIGFGLSGFDAVGQPRTVDDNKQPIDTSGAFLELKPGGEFRGPAELASQLRAMPQVSACFVQQVFRYGLGRSTTPSDQGTLAALGDSFAGNAYAFGPLLSALVRSNAFRFLSTNTTTGAAP